MSTIKHLAIVISLSLLIILGLSSTPQQAVAASKYAAGRKIIQKLWSRAKTPRKVPDWRKGGRRPYEFKLPGNRPKQDTWMLPKPVIERSLEADDFLSKLNSDRNSKFFTVDLEVNGASEGTLYQVYAGNDKPIYEARDITGVVAWLNVMTEKSQTRTIYISIKGLNKQKRAAFATSARIHQQGINRKVSLKVFEADGPTISSQRNFFSERSRDILSATDPSLVTSGAFKGFYAADLIISPAYTLLKSDNLVFLRIFARTKEVAKAFIDFLVSRLSNNPLRMSVAEVLNRAREDFKRTHGYTDKDLHVLLKDEFGQTQFVHIARIGSANA